MRNIGKRLDDFLIVTRIAQSEHAVIYKAYQRSLDRDVALKLFTRDSFDPRADFDTLFLNDVGRVSALEHIHIIPIYGFNVVDQDDICGGYIAMRLMRGGSLQDLLKGHDGRALPKELIEKLFVQIAGALIHAHRVGVIHGNLKPSNIMLDEQTNAYITDFGLARSLFTSERTPRTLGAEIPVYMPPEQLQTGKSGTRSDIYGLGAILYHMMVGRPPYDPNERNLVTFIQRQARRAPATPRSIRPEIAPAMEAVIVRALRQHPSERFATVSDMLGAFARAMGASADVLPRARRGDRVARRLRRVIPLMWRGALVAAGVILVMLWILTQPTGVATMPMVNILGGVTGSIDDVRPTDAEIAAAQGVIGADGFIAYIACTSLSETQAARIREMSEFAAREYDIGVRAYDSDMRDHRQIAQIERARAEGASALILCPITPYADASIASAVSAHIPVINTALTLAFSGTVSVGIDNQALGFNAGAYAGQIIEDEWNGTARVIILGYLIEADNRGSRTFGLHRGVRDAAPGVQIVGTYAGGTRDDARLSVMRLIEQRESFDLILCYADVCAYGVIDALEAAGVAPESVQIISINGESLAQTYVEQRYYMRATQTINRELGSQAAVQAAVKALGGGVLPQTVVIPPGELVAWSAVD
jgi:serine/threonine-protein kinase